MEAFSSYKRMLELAVVHDSFTFPIVNRAVMLMQGDVIHGKMVHCVAIKMGFGLELYFCNTMIEVYCDYDRVDNARKLFDEMTERDLVSWTSMISGYSSLGFIDFAFELFNQLRMENMEPNWVTCIVMLQGCSTPGTPVIKGRLMHIYVMKSGLLSYHSIGNSLLRMYTATSSVEDIKMAFSDIHKRDTITWNILLNFYSKRGDIEEISTNLKEMHDEGMLRIETLTLAISAFAKTGDLLKGENLHGLAIKVGLYDDVFHTCLLDFYAKCGELDNSKRLLHETPHGNNITRSAMMSGLIQNGYFSDAIEFFQQTQSLGLKPTNEILRCLITAYTNLGALQAGKVAHGYLIRNMIHIFDTEEDSLELKTCLINMYMRCGSIQCARLCFSQMKNKDVVICTSMIEGYGIHGRGFEALEIFHLMVEEGVKPNDITFLSLLSSCSHSGLVIEGCEIYNSMRWRYGLTPSLNHHTCVVDILGRCGKLKEALVIIIKLVIYPDIRIWGALLGACRVHEAWKIGEYAAQKVAERDKDSVEYKALVGNIQAGCEKWREVEEVRRVVNKMDLTRKTPGWSYIEDKGRIHGFVSGDTSHPQVEEIYEAVASLNTN